MWLTKPCMVLVLTVHVEVHQARDEVGREGDHKRLGQGRERSARPPSWEGASPHLSLGSAGPGAWSVTHIGKRDPWPRLTK